MHWLNIHQHGALTNLLSSHATPPPLQTITQTTQVMKYLVLKRGADLLTEDVGAFTPLLNAVWRDDPHVVRFFLGRPECTLTHLLVG